MKEFKVGQDYSYDQIMEFKEENDLTLNEYGPSTVEEEAMHLTDDHFNIWFILTGTRSDGYLYTCVFNN